MVGGAILTLIEVHYETLKCGLVNYSVGRFFGEVLFTEATFLDDALYMFFVACRVFAKFHIGDPILHGNFI